MTDCPFCPLRLSLTEPPEKVPGADAWEADITATRCETCGGDAERCGHHPKKEKPDDVEA